MVIFPSGVTLPTVPLALPVNQIVLPSGPKPMPWGRVLSFFPPAQVGQSSCTSYVRSIFPLASRRTICPLSSSVTQRRPASSNSIPCGPLFSGIG